MKFGRAAKHAWLRLRFEFPEVILGPSKEQDENGNLLLELSIPRSDEEAREWVERSLFLDLCKEDQSAEDEIRQAVVKDPVCVRLNARVDQESMVAEVDFAFRVDHMTADGVGAYILAAYFFKFLAHTLSAGEVTFDWEGLKRRLPTPWVGMMNSEQRTEGKQFEDGVKNLTNLVMGASVCILNIIRRVLSLTVGRRRASGEWIFFSKTGTCPKLFIGESRLKKVTPYCLL